MTQDATSIRALGKALGVSDTTVRNWLKRKDFPVQREAPWSPDDITELQTWRKMSLRPDRGAAGLQGRTEREPIPDEQTKDYWLMRKYRAQALEQEGELLSGEAVRQAWVQTLSTIRQRMLLVAQSVRTLCDNQPGDAVEQIVEREIRSALDDVADRVGNLASASEDPDGGGAGFDDAPATEAEPVG